VPCRERGQLKTLGADSGQHGGGETGIGRAFAGDEAEQA